MNSSFLPRKCRPPHCTLCFFHWKPQCDITMVICQHLWSKIHCPVEICTTSRKLDLHRGMQRCFFFFLKKKPVYSLDTVTVKGEGGVVRVRVFHLLIYSPNGCSGRGWARLKPADRNSTLVSHMGDRSQVVGPLSATFPSILTGRNIGNRVIGGTLTWDSGIISNGLAHCDSIQLQCCLFSLKSEFTPINCYKYQIPYIITR